MSSERIFCIVGAIIAPILIAFTIILYIKNKKKWKHQKTDAFEVAEQAYFKSVYKPFLHWLYIFIIFSLSVVFLFCFVMSIVGFSNEEEVKKNLYLLYANKNENTGNTIINSILLVIFIFLIATIVFFIVIMFKKSYTEKKLSEFIKEVENCEESREFDEIKAFIHEEITLNSKLNVASEKYRINNGIIIVEEFLDFRKIKNYDPVKVEEIIITLKNDEIIFKLSPKKQINIKIKEIMYIKGYFEPKRNVVLLEMIFFKELDISNFKFQLKYFEDLHTFNKYIIEKK